jgi:hypothetical protein
MQVFTRKVYSLNDCLNDFTGFMTGVAAILAVAGAIFSYFFFSVEWIELSYYVKTKDYSIFDSNKSHSDKRIKQYFEIKN